MGKNVWLKKKNSENITLYKVIQKMKAIISSWQ